jgi:hypothetical protein
MILQDVILFSKFCCLERLGPDSFIPFEGDVLDVMLVLLLLMKSNLGFLLKSFLKVTNLILKITQMLIEFLLLQFKLLSMKLLPLPGVKPVTC